MADRVLTWYFSAATPATDIAPAYVLDTDYVATRLWVRAKTAPEQIESDVAHVVFDVNVDGTSLFTDKPSIGNGRALAEYEIDGSPLDEGAVVTLDVDSVSRSPGADYSVHLELDRFEL